MSEDKRLREIREALAVCDNDVSVPYEYLSDTVRAVLSEDPPAPRVWLPGDTHETELHAAVDRARDARAAELRAAMIEADGNYQPPPAPEPGADRWVHLRNTCPHGIVRGLITCPVCEPEKQAAAEASARAIVDRARDARANAEWQHTDGVTP